MKRLVPYLILSGLVAIASCSKDPLPKSVDSKLTVALQQTYLGSDKVDSAFAIWKTATQEVRVRLELSANQLRANMAEWPTGAGTLTVQIYGKNNYPGGYSGQWEFREAITINKNSIEVDGPASFADAKWKPRIILKDAIDHEAIVALRPDDPYVLLKDVNHETLKFVVERSYWKTIQGVQMVASKVWNCTSDCTGAANEEYFKTLPTQIGTRTWNHISITLLYTTGPNGEGWGLGFEWDV